MQVPNDSGWWGNVETLALAASGALLGLAGFLWRLVLRIGQMQSAIRVQRRDFEDAKAQTGSALAKMAESVERLREDHHKLHSEVLAQPTKADLRDVEARISDRLDRLSGQVDRLVESRLASR